MVIWQDYPLIIVDGDIPFRWKIAQSDEKEEYAVRLSYSCN